ncbi:MAG: hypothetical protein UU34_C0030G0003 [Candidatus Curtissbacteria bacterium GW2011_GWA1_41_11]|uniref:Glycosyltransferase n=1 Tax=Candidatus Curtissbacteria bacterium GW2011_GWA1_41_11 TaxID=1618409 RepID=A0A0G0UA14_9BACT|nr:MAG: hypothetical protein UU34_C0030G0003 [Candidatus Curtissbacteria bacterium GW2011_GWA1_41_11]
MKKMQKAKIVISSYDDVNNPFYGGGGAYAVCEVAKSLAADFKVTVVTGKYPGSKNKIQDKVLYKRIGIAKAGPKVGQLIYYFFLPFYFLFQEFDLWIESFTPPFSTSFLQLFTQKPVIGLVHMLSGEDMRRKYRLPFEIIEKLGLKTYKYFIVPTESVKKKILQINAQAYVNIIPNGINQIKISKNNVKTKKNILYLGRIEVNQKGLDLLIEAFSKIANHIPYELIIAGSGASGEINKLKKIIKEFDIEDKIKLLGRVEGSVKNNLFSNTIFTVIPSRFETFSTVALESLAHGLPIISFGIDGLSWVPQGLSLKVKSFNSNALARAMQTLSQNAALRRRLQVAGLKFSKRNSWHKSLEEYSRYTYQILNGGGV